MVEGEATLVTDPAVVADMAARWAAGGWPARGRRHGRGAHRGVQRALGRARRPGTCTASRTTRRAAPRPGSTGASRRRPGVVAPRSSASASCRRWVSARSRFMSPVSPQWRAAFRRRRNACYPAAGAATPDRTWMHPGWVQCCRDGLREHARRGGLQQVAERVLRAGRLESQGPPVLAVHADLGEFHRAPGLLARPRAVARDWPAGQGEPADPPFLAYRFPAGQVTAVLAGRAHGKDHFCQASMRPRARPATSRMPGLPR